MCVHMHACVCMCVCVLGWSRGCNLMEEKGTVICFGGRVASN